MNLALKAYLTEIQALLWLIASILAFEFTYLWIGIILLIAGILALLQACVLTAKLKFNELTKGTK